MEGFRFQIFDIAKATGQKPFFGGGVGGLRIHIDKPVGFSYGDQVKLGLSVGITGALTPNLGTLGQQLPAAACIFYMADFQLTIYFDMGDKPIGPCLKNAGHHVLITHNIHLMAYHSRFCSL